MRFGMRAGILCAIVACVSCDTSISELPALAPREVTYWAYQIHELTRQGAVSTLAKTTYDMLVIEPTRTDVSSEDSAGFDTAEVVGELKASAAHDGSHRKLILAYINISAAENSRWYWTWSSEWSGEERPADWPEFILKPDSDGGSGKYTVAYWAQDWKDIIINGVADSGQDYASVMDEVISDGFDGVYLDGVEAFEDSGVYDAAVVAGKDPADEMIALLREIRAYAAARGKPDFVVMQQNALSLIAGHPELVEQPGAIDGIAQEGVWYSGESVEAWGDPAGYDIATDPLLTNYFLALLARYQDADIPVFVCEYAVQHAAVAYSHARGYGFVPYVTRAPLSRLSTTSAMDY